MCGKLQHFYLNIKRDITVHLIKVITYFFMGYFFSLVYITCLFSKLIQTRKLIFQRVLRGLPFHLMFVTKMNRTGRPTFRHNMKKKTFLDFHSDMDFSGRY